MAGLDAINEVGNDIDGEDDTADATSGLAVYNDPNVQTAMTAFNKLAAEQQARYDAQAKALAEKRYGPSFSERMYQLSAAFAAPTSTRGFSGVMGNVMPVLQKQQEAQREGEIKREDALNALQAAQLNQRLGLAKQGLATATAMARINATANKPVRGVAVGDTLRDPYTNAPIGTQYNRVPKPEYYKALEAAPTPENLQAAVAYYPTFAVDLKAAYERGLKNKGR